MTEEYIKTVTVHMDNLNTHPHCSHGNYCCLFLFIDIVGRKSHSFRVFQQSVKYFTTIYICFAQKLMLYCIVWVTCKDRKNVISLKAF